jgi:adenylate cyclase
MAADRLTGEELALETDSDSGRIAQLDAAGILRRGADGAYVHGDIQRVLVANALIEAGLSLELLKGGIEAGVVSFEETDLLYAPPGRADRSVAQLADELGLAVETLLRVITALGLPRPDPTTRLRAPDVEHLRSFVEAWRPLGDDDLVVRAARAYGDGLYRAAETWLGMFEREIVAPLVTRAVPWQEMRVRVFEPGRRVLDVGRSMLPWMLDQHLFGLLNQANFDTIEQQLALLGMTVPPPRQESAILFTDLTGFTRLTEERGDEEAATVATRLAVEADEVARRHEGRLVKLLGDGVMLHFARAADALAAAVDLRAAMAPAGLPPAHSGLHVGRVIHRESDFYGRTVNIAARLAAVAGPDQILATDAVIEAMRSDGTRLPDLDEPSRMELRGVPQPISVYRIG